MRGGGSAEGRCYATARYARWWVGHSGALPERASGAPLKAADGCELFELDQCQHEALNHLRRSPDGHRILLFQVRAASCG